MPPEQFIFHNVMKTRRLPTSELFQRTAIQAEIRRLDLLEETDRYLIELLAQVGEPRPVDRARARAIATRIARRSRSRVRKSAIDLVGERRHHHVDRFAQ